jgi:hypothetical protein
VFVESAPLQQSRVRNNPSEARNRVTGWVCENAQNVAQPIFCQN